MPIQNSPCQATNISGGRRIARLMLLCRAVFDNEGARRRSMSDVLETAASFVYGLSYSVVSYELAGDYYDRQNVVSCRMYCLSRRVGPVVSGFSSYFYFKLRQAASETEDLASHR